MSGGCEDRFGYALAEFLVDVELHGCCDYYRNLLAGDTLSPSRRRLIEAEVRKLESMHP